MVEIAGQLEEKYLDLFNQYFSHTVIGVYDYTIYFMLVISIIEEGVKIFTMVLLLSIKIETENKYPKLRINRNGYKSPYNTLGVGCVFAGMETYIYVQSFPKINPAKDLIELRLYEGAMMTHIAIAFVIFTCLNLINYKKIIMTLGLIFAITLHTIYNYHTILMRTLYTYPEWMINYSNEIDFVINEKMLPIWIGIAITSTLLTYQKIYQQSNTTLREKCFLYFLIIAGIFGWTFSYYNYYSKEFRIKFLTSITFIPFMVTLFIWSNIWIKNIQFPKNRESEIIPNV